MLTIVEPPDIIPEGTSGDMNVGEGGQVNIPESKCWYYIDPASSVELEGSMKNIKLYKLLFYLDIANSCLQPFSPCCGIVKMLMGIGLLRRT